MTNRPRGASGSSNPYIAAASGLRQRVYLADFVGCSLPRFGSIATFDRGLLGTARVGSSNAALAVGSAATCCAGVCCSRTGRAGTGVRGQRTGARTAASVPRIGCRTGRSSQTDLQHPPAMSRAGSPSGLTRLGRVPPSPAQGTVGEAHRPQPTSRAAGPRQHGPGEVGRSPRCRPPCGRGMVEPAERTCRSGVSEEVRHAQ